MGASFDAANEKFSTVILEIEAQLTSISGAQTLDSAETNAEELILMLPDVV